MSGWDDLKRELDNWGAGASLGRPFATLWWRDDDATETSPALDRLLGLGRGYQVPLTLAVVPARADVSLADVIARHPSVVPVQHGYAHLNHAKDGSKNGELGPARSTAENSQDITAGAKRMRALFREASLPVLVPPWNRIDPALLRHLPDLGLRGLSAFGPRTAAEPVPGLVQVNSHVDIIDWRGNRGFVGDTKALRRMIEHLEARRRGAVDADEPSGLLTHHRVHDAGCWEFLERLFAVSSTHPAARWLAAQEVFGGGAAPRCRQNALSS